MLTPKDIENSNRKSGYEHVNKMERLGKPLPAKPYRGYGKAVQRPGVKYANEWLGPARATALEAAQDYCDHENAKATLLTPKDLVNPNRKSGYDHVNSATGGQGTNPKDHGDRKPRWRASWRTSATDNAQRGPARATALEAAQDYCDHENSNPSVAPVPKVPDLKPRARVKVTDTRTRKDGFPGAMKHAIHARAGGRCECCALAYPHPEAHHIDPDGLHAMENGASICRNCHGRINHGGDAIAVKLNLILTTKRGASSC